MYLLINSCALLVTAYEKTTDFSVVCAKRLSISHTGLAMSGGFLCHLRRCDAREQSTLRFSLLDSLNSLLLPSLLCTAPTAPNLWCLVVEGFLFWKIKKPLISQWFIVRSDVLLSQGEAPNYHRR